MCADWNAIRKQYITGTVSLRQLAEKYGVSIDSMKKKAAAEKWTEKRQKAGTKIAQRIEKSAVSAGTRKMDTLIEAGEILMGKTRAMVAACDDPDTLDKLWRSMERAQHTMAALYRIPDVKTEAELERLRLETDQRKKELNAEQTGVKIRIEAPEEGLDE